MDRDVVTAKLESLRRCVERVRTCVGPLAVTPTFAVALAGQTRGLDERGGNGRRGFRGAILEDPLAAGPVERAALSVDMRA